MPNVPRVPGGEPTTACPSMSSDDSFDHHNDCDAMEVEAPSNDATKVGDGTQAEGIVGRTSTKQQYSTLFLNHFVNDIMKTYYLCVTRQTTLSRMETPILLCGNAVAIIDVKLNDVLFGGVHDAQSLSGHDGNKRMFTLVKNVLTSKPTTGAKKDRRHDIMSIIDALVANGARFLRCDTEKECFFPMDMALVRARMKSLFFHGMKKIEKHFELCENFHTLLKVYTNKGKYQVIIILIYLFLYTFTYQI